MTEISFEGNPIETIDDAAFEESLNTLETLTFSGARFTAIPDPVLQLPVLKSLSISDSSILVWNQEAMERLGTALHTLHLNNVGLTAWPNWIQTFSNLTELSISDNIVSPLPDTALSQAANTLRVLQLNNDSLTMVPKAVSKLTALRTLSLQHNKISDVTFLPQSDVMTVMSLNNNKISNSTQLSMAMRITTTSMFTLNIYNNELTSIPDLPFLASASYLDFSNNRISDPISGSVQNSLSNINLQNNFLPLVPRILKKLNFVPTLFLSFNHIATLQGFDFPNSTSSVILEHNLITELTDTSFPPKSIIGSLSLNYNPIVKISLLAFETLPNLVELSLQYTKLTRLPLAISSLKRLIILDFSGSDSLVCTCLESSLQSRISSLSQGDVHGYCGEVSVYEFFTQLSPECLPASDF